MLSVYPDCVLNPYHAMICSKASRESGDDQDSNRAASPARTVPTAAHLAKIRQCLGMVERDDWAND
jgi:hypothetical protein